MWLYVLLIITILLLLVSFSMNKEDIIAPSVVVCATFTISELFAVANIKKWNIHYSCDATLILLFGISLFLFCDLICRSFFIRRRKHVGQYNRAIVYIDVKSKIVRLVILFSLIMIPLYFYSLIKIVRASGLTGSMTVVLKSLTYDSNRTTSTAQSTWMTILYKIDFALAYVFMYIYLNNRAIIKEKKIIDRKNKYLLCVPVLYNIATLFQGSRLQILLFVAYAFIVNYIQAQNLNHWKHFVSRKFLFRAVCIIAVALPAFYFILDLLGRSNANLSMMDYLAIYAGGSIQHFNQFIENPVSNSDVWGKECFYSIYNLLWKLGLYSNYISPHLEFRLLYQIGTSGQMTYRGNVYTFFRSPLSDFGILGMCIVTISVGLFYSTFYFSKIYKRIPSHFSIVIYAYLFAQLTMISIANQITIMISAYGIINIAMLYIVLKFVIKTSKKFVVE